MIADCRMVYSNENFLYHYMLHLSISHNRILVGEKV